MSVCFSEEHRELESLAIKLCTKKKMSSNLAEMFEADKNPHSSDG